MLKTLILAWVKNVNKLRVNSSKTGVFISPITANTITTQTSEDVQLPVMQDSIHRFSEQLSTLNLTTLYLSFSTYTHYPQGLLLEPLKIN